MTMTFEEIEKKISPETKALLRAVAGAIKADVLPRIAALEENVGRLASAEKVSEIECKLRAEIANLRRMKGRENERTN